MGESIVERVNKLGSELQELDSTRIKLLREVKALAEQRVQQQEEVEAQEQHLKKLRLTLPDGAGDEVLHLDVGGQHFKARRSTLSQFEGSLLASLASARWADAAKSEDGLIFLDMDPDAFGEVLAFLRERRFSQRARADFSRKAARLAEYLGVPVDSTMGETYIALQVVADSGANVNGLMFDLSMKSRWGCILKAISCWVVGARSTLIVYALKGSCIGAPETDSTRWSGICQEEVSEGSNRIDLPRSANLCIAPFGTLALLLFCTGSGRVRCCKTAPALKYVDLSRTTVGELNKGMHLFALPGKLSGKGGKPFHHGPHQDPRYFAGTIEYVLD